jgi:chlorite dismutase
MLPKNEKSLHFWGLIGGLQYAQNKTKEQQRLRYYGIDKHHLLFIHAVQALQATLNRVNEKVTQFNKSRTSLLSSVSRSTSLAVSTTSTSSNSTTVAGLYVTRLYTHISKLYTSFRA